MKHNIILAALILSIILTNLLLYVHYKGKFQETSQTISQLTKELVSLKQQVSNQNAENAEQLEYLSATLTLVRSEEKQRSSDVAEYSKALHDGLEQVNRDFSKKYAALRLDFQTPTPNFNTVTDQYLNEKLR